MITGRPPKPTHLKILNGNPGGRPLNTREPKPVGDLKEPPAHYDDELREVWHYYIDNCPKGLLKRIDSGVLEVWCEAHVLHRKAVENVRKFGMLVKPKNSDVPVQSPWLPIVNKQAFMMLRAGSEMGFSPASRTRIAMGEAGEKCGAWDDVAV